MGAVLGRAFDDCLVTESIFKLLQIFGNLIQRTLIAHELNDRMPTLVQMLDQEMEDAKIIFQKQKQRIKVIYSAANFCFNKDLCIFIKICELCLSVFFSVCLFVRTLIN